MPRHNPRLPTSAEHRAAAERLLSRASHVRSDSDPSPHLDPQTTALLIARAQVHATLAASQDADVVAAYIHDDHDTAFEPSCTACVDESAASTAGHLEAMRRVVAAHICEGLTSPSREMRRFLRGLATELDGAGVNVDADVDRIARQAGYGPHRYSLDSVVYSLDHQWIDALGVVWEHSGDWAAIGGPLMGTPDVSPQLPQQPFNDLAWTRGPLRSAKEAPDRECGLPATPSFDPETKIYVPWGTPQRSFDLTKPLEDNDGNVWRWTGEFDAACHDEPMIELDAADGQERRTAILSAVEVFDGPLHQLETDADGEDAAGVS
jgi:hypothetical protein